MCYKVNWKHVVSSYFRLNIYVLRGPKLSNFKIEGPIMQNNKNRGTKTVIKSKNIWENKYFKKCCFGLITFFFALALWFPEKGGCNNS
jgi:hypothetical protein